MSAREVKWLSAKFDYLVGCFEQFCVPENVTKTTSLISTSNYIWGGYPKSIFHQFLMVKVVTASKNGGNGFNYISVVWACPKVPQWQIWWCSMLGSRDQYRRRIWRWGKRSWSRSTVLRVFIMLPSNIGFHTHPISVWCIIFCGGVTWNRKELKQLLLTLIRGTPGHPSPISRRVPTFTSIFPITACFYCFQFW